MGDQAGACLNRMSGFDSAERFAQCHPLADGSDEWQPSGEFVGEVIHQLRKRKHTMAEARACPTLLFEHLLHFAGSRIYREHFIHRAQPLTQYYRKISWLQAGDGSRCIAIAT